MIEENNNNQPIENDVDDAVKEPAQDSAPVGEDAENPSEDAEPKEEKDEGFQSIFDKPAEKVTKKKKGKLSREMRNIIIIFLICIGLGLGVFAIFKFIPKDDNSTSSEAGSSVFSNTSGEPTYIFDYSPYLTSFDNTASLELGGITSVHVKNSSSEFTTKPKIVKEKQYNSATLEEEEIDAVNWDVSEIKDQDFKNVKFSSSYLGFVVGDVLHIAYKSVHTEDKNAKISQGNMTYMQECGLDKPAAEITVVFKEGSSYTVLLGNKTPTDNEYYLTINATPSGSGKKGEPKVDNKIYRIGSDVMAYYVKEVKYYVDRNLFTPPTDQTTYTETGDEIPDKYFTEGQLTGFDSIKIDGSNFEDAMTFSVVDNTYPGYTGMYMMDKPYKKNCTTGSIDKLLSPIGTGVAAKETIAMVATEADKANYGINSPTCRINYVIKGVTYTMTLGNRIVTPVSDLSADASSGSAPTYYSVMVNDNPSLFIISTADISFYNMQPKDYYTKDIYSCNIKQIKTVSVKPASGSETTFTVDHPKDDDGNDAEITVKAGSKVVDAVAFKNYYQKIISLQAIQFTDDGSTASDPVLTLSFTYTSVSKTDVIKFYKYAGSERRYYCTVNGSGIELLDKASVDEISSELSTLLK